MTFIYELDPHSPEIYRMCKYKLPTSMLPKLYPTPLRRWSIIIIINVLIRMTLLRRRYRNRLEIQSDKRATDVNIKIAIQSAKSI